MSEEATTSLTGIGSIGNGGEVHTFHLDLTLGDELGTVTEGLNVLISFLGLLQTGYRTDGEGYLKALDGVTLEEFLSPVVIGVPAVIVERGKRDITEPLGVYLLLKDAYCLAFHLRVFHLIFIISVADGTCKEECCKDKKMFFH